MASESTCGVSGLVVRSLVTHAKLCTVTAFQREKKRKKEIRKRRFRLIKTKCLFLQVSQYEERHLSYIS